MITGFEISENKGSPIGNSSLGLISLEEFLLRGLETPEHIITEFKIGYANAPIVIYEGSYLEVKDKDTLSFISKDSMVTSYCGFTPGLIGNIELSILHVYYLELFNSLYWKPYL